MTTVQIIAANIVRLRAARKLSRPLTERRAKIAASALYVLENGTGNPCITTLDKVAKALEVATWELLLPAP